MTGAGLAAEGLLAEGAVNRGAHFSVHRVHAAVFLSRNNSQIEAIANSGEE